MGAQSSLSGTWTGYMGKSESTPTPVTFDVKQAPDGKLTGTLKGPHIMPGDVKEGSYDAASGALKFTIKVRATSDDQGGEVFFDGRVAKDTASGAVLLRGEKGVFKWARHVPGATPATAAPQDAGIAAAKRGFVEVSGWITRAADLVPAEKYSYKPTATVRTYGQLVAHIADGYRYYCARAAGKNQEWSDATEKGATTKAAVVQALRQATADCTSAYASGKEVAAMMENVGHSNLHYGNMITYIRMMGMTPPSS
jgi:hypothetical protein